MYKNSWLNPYTLGRNIVFVNVQIYRNQVCIGFRFTCKKVPTDAACIYIKIGINQIYKDYTEHMQDPMVILGATRTIPQLTNKPYQT